MAFLANEITFLRFELLLVDIITIIAKLTVTFGVSVRIIFIDEAVHILLALGRWMFKYFGQPLDLLFHFCDLRLLSGLEEFVVMQFLLLGTV